MFDCLTAPGKRFTSDNRQAAKAVDIELADGARGPSADALDVFRVVAWRQKQAGAVQVEGPDEP